MQRTEDEIVGYRGAGLVGGFVIVALLQILLDRRGQREQLAIERARRPAAPIERPPRQAISQAWKFGIAGVPRQAPDFIAGHAILPDGTQIRDAGDRRRVQSQPGQILRVLGQQERAAFQHQNAVAVELVRRKNVLGQRGTESAAADYDYAERTGIGARVLVGAAHRFVHSVAYVTPENIAREIGNLSGGTGGHDSSSGSCSSLRLRTLPGVQTLGTASAKTKQ